MADIMHLQDMLKLSGIDSVFETYQSIYKDILAHLYPSLGATGFTERNQTVNFIEAYKQKNKNCFAWYEFPCPSKKKCHYDAILIDDKVQCIFVIEAKRINSKGKKDSVKKDIERMSEFYSAMAEEKGERIKDFEKYDVCGIILADIWLSDYKKWQYRRNLFANWENGVCFSNEVSSEAKYFSTKKEVYESGKEKYHLLMLVWKLASKGKKLRRINMEQPNIFDYATSELSQDAFICYLLAFGKEEYKDTNLQEYKMAHDFLSLCNIDADEEIKEIKKQYKSIDVLIVTDKHLLIVEDKTGTGEHDDQIVRYVKELQNDDLYKDKQIKVCYLKTQNYVYGYKTSDDKVLPQECCRSLQRDDMLRLIKPNRQCNLIFESFYNRLNSVNKGVKACDDNNIFDWNEDKWFDYLSSLLKAGNVWFDLGWVNNAQGGFYGCWFDFKKAGNGKDYKQIEISFENGKTSKVKLCHKFSSENKETTVNSKSVIKALQNKVVKNGFMPPNRIGIGITTTYAYKTAQNKADVEAFIK